MKRGAEDPLAEAIWAAFASVERSFELRFTELLLRSAVPGVYDVAPWTDRLAGPGGRERQDEGRRETAAEFLLRFPDPADGLVHIASRIGTIEAMGVDQMQVAVSCRVIAAHLAELAPDYTADLCERAVLGPPSPLLSDLPPWLYRVQRTRPDRYLRLAHQILRVGGALECAALAATLWDPEGPSLDGAEDLLAQMLAHPDSRVQWEALAALWLLARRDPECATKLALTMKLGRSAKVADRFAATFVMWHPGVDALPSSVWDALLEKLVPVDHLDTGSPQAEANWMPWLYCLASAGYGDAGLRVLREWIDDRGAPGVLAACGLLRVVGPEFLLDRAEFIQILLARADAAGVDVLDTVRTTLYDVVDIVAAEGAEAGVASSLWPPLVQIQEKGQALSQDRGIHRAARDFYRELTRLAEERIRDARDSEEERLL